MQLLLPLLALLLTLTGGDCAPGGSLAHVGRGALGAVPAPRALLCVCDCARVRWAGARSDGASSCVPGLVWRF